MASYCRATGIRFELPEYPPELYLTKNGLPVHHAANQLDLGDPYCGDSVDYNEFRNPDNRMLMSVFPPFLVKPRIAYSSCKI